MRILMTGGGTLGPVTALLAVADDLKDQHEVRWIGTYRGPEARLLVDRNYSYLPIFSAKFRRYVSLRTIFNPLFFCIGFLQSFVILITWRPRVIVSAGGFVSVPVVIAGWILGIPSLIHQQDVIPGLANRIMAPFARRITVAVPETADKFDARKTTVVGNPVRKEIEDVVSRRTELRAEALKKFRLDDTLPVVLVTGGGSGAQALNATIGQIADDILRVAHIIILTGKGKGNMTYPGRGEFVGTMIGRELVDEDMPLVYAAADLVVSRAGMGTISELLVLGTPAVVVPIPHTHQEANAAFFVEHGGGVVVQQNAPDFPERLLHAIRHTLDAERTHAATRSVASQTFGASARHELAKIIVSL